MRDDLDLRLGQPCAGKRRAHDARLRERKRAAARADARWIAPRDLPMVSRESLYRIRIVETAQLV